MAPLGKESLGIWSQRGGLPSPTLFLCISSKIFVSFSLALSPVIRLVLAEIGAGGESARRECIPPRREMTAYEGKQRDRERVEITYD